jgi:hypothetical protein
MRNNHTARPTLFNDIYDVIASTVDLEWRLRTPSRQYVSKIPYVLKNAKDDELETKHIS